MVEQLDRARHTCHAVENYMSSRFVFIGHDYIQWRMQPRCLFDPCLTGHRRHSKEMSEQLPVRQADLLDPRHRARATGVDLLISF